MADVKILSLIPESMRPELIKEVEALIKERDLKKPAAISPDIKNFVTKNLSNKKSKL